MADLRQIHCKACGQTYFTTQVGKCTLCGAEPEAVAPTSVKPDYESLPLFEKLATVALAQLDEGVADSEIEAGLVGNGLDRGKAADLLSTVKADHARLLQVVQSAGKRNMLAGAAWFVGGATVTVLTFCIAAASNNGVVVFAYGAIIGGLIQFFRGLYQYQYAARRSR